MLKISGLTWLMLCTVTVRDRKSPFWQLPPPRIISWRFPGFILVHVSLLETYHPAFRIHLHVTNSNIFLLHSFAAVVTVMLISFSVTKTCNFGLCWTTQLVSETAFLKGMLSNLRKYTSVFVAEVIYSNAKSIVHMHYNLTVIKRKSPALYWATKCIISSSLTFTVMSVCYLVGIFAYMSF